MLLSFVASSKRATKATHDSIPSFLAITANRTTHIHILVHHNDSSINDNSILTGGTVTHVGQFFFDQDLNGKADEVSPCSTNTATVVENEDDSIFGEEADPIDPIVEYVFLGAVFGRYRNNAMVSINPAATLTEDGGVADEDSGSVPGGNGAPSGSGAPPSASASASA